MKEAYLARLLLQSEHYLGWVLFILQGEYYSLKKPQIPSIRRATPTSTKWCYEFFWGKIWILENI